MMRLVAIGLLLLLFCGCVENTSSTGITFLHRGVLSQDKNGQYYFAWVEDGETYAIPVIPGLIPEYREEE
jgi:hypothetical protein